MRSISLARLSGLLVSLLLLSPTAIRAEERWVSITLERTPIVDRRGKTVDRPVFYSRDRRRLTTGGVWIVPGELVRATTIERYQRGDKLLVLVEIPPVADLPGAVMDGARAAQMKQEVFGIAPAAEVESGVTNPSAVKGH